MSGNGAGFAVDVFAYSGSDENRAYASRYAAYEVNRRGTGEVMETEVGKPSSSPYPMSGDGINKKAYYRAVNTVTAELGSFCHGTGNYGRRSGTEDGLEDKVSEKVHSFGQDSRIISGGEEVYSAEHGALGAEHNTETYQPVKGSPDREVHQVFHNDVACVFGTGEARFHHSETCLHKEYEGCSYQYPHSVNIRKKF